MNGFGLREAESVMDAVNDVGFCEGHSEGSCFGFWVFIALSGWFVKVLGNHPEKHPGTVIFPYRAGAD